MEKWQIISICDLKAFRQKEKSIQNLEERLQEVKDRCGSIQAVRYDREPTSGGGFHSPEDQWLNDLVLSQELKAQLRAVRFEVYHIRKTLDELEPEERTVLEGFYIDRQPRYIDKLIAKLHLEKSSIYRLKDKALESYVLIAYGATSYH